MSTKKFVTAVNCMDGRVQLPVIEWMKNHYAVDYVDMITEPGPIKILAENTPRVLIDSLRSRVKVSVGKHASTCIAVVGHIDCAGNPVGKETQIEQITASVKRIQDWKLPTPVIGLWVDEQWTVERVL
ncbi:MAG: hypothetical protein JW840_02895 [Candidatus Thermoplasmatota archaeon]|nr:hypothetical protein [Candidatus Thermoplasmatota archaeon]